MIKQNRTYRIIALGLACLLFFSTSGLSLDMHFCQGKIKRINLLGKAKTCAEIKNTKQTCKHHKPKEKKDTQAVQTCSSNSDHKGCCENQSFKIDLDTEFSQSQVNATPDVRLDFLVAFTLVFIQPAYNFLFVQKQIYRPPLPKHSLVVLFQQFLI